MKLYNVRNEKKSVPLTTHLEGEKSGMKETSELPVPISASYP
jgi:hypothetical protein